MALFKGEGELSVGGEEGGDIRQYLNVSLALLVC